MRGIVLLAYCCFLLLTGFRTENNQPAGLSFSPVHHIEKSLPVNKENTLLIADEIADEDERINNALARKCRLLTDLSFSLSDLFDLNYLDGFTKDRLSLGDLPDIYITQRALRI